MQITIPRTTSSLLIWGLEIECSFVLTHPIGYMGKEKNIRRNIGPEKTVVPAGKSGMEYQSSGIVKDLAQIIDRNGSGRGIDTATDSLPIEEERLQHAFRGDKVATVL